MSLILSVVGGVAAAVGLVLVGFVIPTGEFTGAGVLVTAGMTAIMGGLILIGFGAVVGELRRIAQALAARRGAHAVAPVGATESVASARPDQADRIPFPARQKRSDEQGELQPVEAQPSVVLSPAGPGTAPVSSAEPLRKSIPPLGRVDADSPAAETAGSESAPAPAQGTVAALEVEVDETEKLVPIALAEASVRTTGGRPEAPRRAGEPGLAPVRTETFDAVWPAEARPAKPRPLAAAPPTHALVAAPPTIAEPAANSMQRGADERARALPAGQSQAVSIVKSGVIDGMAYTLYSDGSIEAQLAQGTVRFRSINDLRMHLENAA